MKTRLSIVLIFIGLNSHAQYFGERNHPMRNHSPNEKILKFWPKFNKKSDIQFYVAIENVLSKGKNIGFENLSKSNDFNALAKKQNRQLLAGPLLGDLNCNKVTVWVRTLNESEVKIKLNSEDGKQMFFSKIVKSKLSEDLSCKIEIKNLTPNTIYNYEIYVDNKIVSMKRKLSFVTAPRKKSIYSIAFGSCPHRWGLGNHRLFRNIKNENPIAMLLLGDIAVQDRNDNISMHRADYIQRDMHYGWYNFSSQIPVYANWDDHDYFDNDKWGIPKEYAKDAREKVREVFKNSWPNPSFGKDDEGIYFKTSISDCDIFMTDNRYFRTKDQFLGKKQFEWLKKSLLESKAIFKILTCGSMWSDYVSKGKDSWGTYEASAREDLFQFIEKNNISGVLFLSGDRHGARGFRIPRKNGFQFYEFEAASLGARVGPPVKKDEWVTQLFGFDGIFAFGMLDINTKKEDPEISMRLVDENSNELYKIKLKLSELTPDKF
jgi:alkaline phosphatase D